MKKLMFIVLIVAFAATTAVTSFATPDKADGKKCTQCHMKDKDANGGPKDKGPGNGGGKKK